MIRRLLRKSHSDQVKKKFVFEEGVGEMSVFNSDPEINDQEDESEIASDYPPMEISISVPNLSEISLVRPSVFRSISDNEENEKNRSLRMKMERRAKNREKLMSMKRYSGFLKRPEILETVYSVEEDGGKPTDGENSKPAEKEITKVDTADNFATKDEETERRESETTEYDIF